MALSHVTTAANNGFGSSITQSISCTSSESYRMLVVFVGWYDASDFDITAATYDGVALTLVRLTEIASASTKHAVYVMPEGDLPASGSATISISFSGSVDHIFLQAALAESDTKNILVLDDNAAGSTSSTNTQDVTYDNTGKDVTSTLVYDSTFKQHTSASDTPSFSPDNSQTEIQDVGVYRQSGMCLSHKSVSSASTFIQSHTCSVTSNNIICSGVVLDEGVVNQDITAPLITATGENASTSISRTKDVTAPLITASGENVSTSISRTKDVTGVLLTASGLIPSDTIDNGTVITGVLLTASGLNPSTSITFDQILTAPLLTATGIQSPGLSYDQFITGTLQTASGDIAGSISYDQLVTAILLQASGPIVPTFTFSQSVSGVVLSATGLIAAENIKNVWGNTDAASALTWSNTDASTSLTWSNTDASTSLTWGDTD